MDLWRILVTLWKKWIELYPYDSISKEWIIYYDWETPDAEDISLIKEYCKNNDIVIKRASEKEKKQFEDYSKNMIIEAEE